MINLYNLISSDSLGNVLLWDTITGTLLYSIYKSSGDILSLCLSPNEKMLFVSGSDSKICSFHFNNNRWIYSCSKRSHINDVTCLIINNSKLISGSNDSFIVSYDYNNFFLTPYTKYYPFIKNYNTSICPDKNLILSKTGNNNLRLYYISNPPNLVVKCLVEFEMALNGNINNFLLSPNGKFVIVTTRFENKLYSIDYDDNNKIESLELPDEIKNIIITSVLFNQSSSMLIFGGENGIIYIIDLTNFSVRFKIGEEDNIPIVSLYVSNDGQYLCSKRYNKNHIDVIDIDSGEVSTTIPLYIIIILLEEKKY